MKYCEKCSVSVRGDRELCPLCQSRLTGEGEPEPFPAVSSVYRQFERLFKWLLFATVSAAIICVAINLMLPDTGAWSLFALLGLGCFWIIMYLSIKRKSGIARYIANQAAVVAVGSVVWDYVTGWRGWSLDYAMPIAFTAAMLAITVVSRVLRSDAGDYITSLVLIGLGGLIPLVFYFTGVLLIVIPSIICVACSLILFVGLLVFKGSEMKYELSKRFHV
ncbi:MAG: hypothetical protein GX067_07075 [Clostridiales bacterium]|jgi:hypothetical protein|nr:hypothetical protein [Clostridiales bacterium]